MSSNIKFSSLVLSLLFAFTFNSFSQSQIELSVQGLLKAGEEIIANDHFNIQVKLNPAKNDGEVLWSFSEDISTNESGWFSFNIPEINKYLGSAGNTQKPLSITLKFLPVSDTKWIISGGDLEVSYTILPGEDNTLDKLTLTRMGDSLEGHSHSKDHLYSFKDSYPYLYLTTGFLFTDAPPLSQSNVNDLRQWISPPADTSRGVKGTFPKGGYRKK